MLTSITFCPALAGGLILFFILERMVCAILGLFKSPESVADSLKQATSSDFLVYLLETLCHFLFSGLYAAVNLASSLLSVLTWACVVLMMGSVLYVCYEQSPWVWTDLIRAYNAFFGPFFQSTVIQILNLFNMVFKGLIPLWNSVFFFISRSLQGYLLPVMIQEASTFESLGASLFELAKTLCVSLFSWMQSVVVDCPLSQGEACFDTSGRTLDLVTPMASLRDAVISCVAFAHTICTPVGPIVDILTYPFMDLNFATGVHSLVNAVLYLFVQSPDVTVMRCARYGQEASLMCTPDLEPVFSFLVSGVGSLGIMVDNWLDVVYVVVQGVLGFPTHCQTSMAPPFLYNSTLGSSLFGENRTGIVGLTGWLMAVTDGWVVAYYGRGSMRVSSWPSPVNISYGLAAVTYARSSNLDVTRLSSSSYASSTAILGCSCSNANGLKGGSGQGSQGMNIQCTILPYEGLLANQSTSIQVFSQQAGNLACSDVDIIVQSVRWPATRFTSATTTAPDCALASSCNQVDATIWVIPRAGCGPESSTCACFPFCMASRLTASQASPLVLYGAEEWRNKVYMVRRDCNLQSSTPQLQVTVTVSDAAGAASSGVSSTQQGVGSPQYVVGGAVSCTDNLLVTSQVNRSLHPAYDAPTPAFLRDPLAPFVITGDTLFTSIKHGDAQYTVRIERLTGATGTEYTLSTVSNNFPSSPPPDVPSAIFSQYPHDHLTTPYARQATTAVSSKGFVFYAVNPAMQVYEAYLNYCRNNQKLPQFGLIMESSFSPIRIWRVDAYRRCDASGCGANLVSQVDIPDAFSNGTYDSGELSYDCTKSYNEAIEQLEYINEINIAVTVKRTDVTASLVEYHTYWLNVQTMQLNPPDQGPWQDQAQDITTAMGAYTLCPAMQVLPELGSMVAGLVNAAILLVKTVVGVVVYFPGIISLWSSGTVCPLHTRGHSVLQQCGSEAFLLDDFFSSLQSSTNIFWSSLTMLSSAIGRTTNTDAGEFVQNGLDGVARYGAGSIDLWTASFKVLSVMKAGPSTVVESMPTTLLMGGAQGGLKISSNTLGWARFGYTCAVKMSMTITQNVLQGQRLDSSRAWRIVVNTLDEMRDEYESDVVDNMRQSCAGISLMMGLTNPWAVFVYQQCIAANTMLSSGVDLTLSVFNLAPFTQCMCSGSAGQVFGDYARAYCVPQASTRLRPVLLQMIQASDVVASGPGFNSAQQLCHNMISYTKSEMVASVQPWFNAQFASLDALGSSIDYAMSWLDPKAGQCLNYNQDPDVVVIMPYPVDYFQACGSTSLCRAKCAGVWDAFDSSLAASSSQASFTQTVSVDVESLFFPSMTVDSFNPMDIMAVTEPSAQICARVCGGQNSGVTNPCVAVAGVRGGAVQVFYYCIPMMMTSSVYRTRDSTLEWTFPTSSDWSDNLLQLQFGDTDGQYLVALASPGGLYLGNRLVNQTLATVATQDLQMGYTALLFTSLQVFCMPPYASIHLNVLVRSQSSQISGRSLHRKLVISTAAFPVEINWVNVELGSSPLTLFAQLSGYSASQVSAFNPANFILIPQSDGLPMNLWQLQWDTSISNGVVEWQLTTLSSTPPGMGTLISGGGILSQNCYIDSEGAYIAFAGAPSSSSTSWLSQLRINGASAAAYSSQTVPVQVSTTTQCSVNSCLGCPDGEVQSLCDAVQACTVINCIGTPVNMRRVLCQLGQTLADESRQNLAVLFGGWVVFVDMFMVMMDLSLQKGLTGITISFPDDSFFGYVCTVKDKQAHFISIFTSAINDVVQISHSAMTYLEGGAHTIDSNFNALVTMPITALTSFLYQIFLGPIYVLIVTQKIMMCNVEGVVAVFDTNGFSISIGDATLQAASSSLVGQCLTQNFVTRSSNPTDTSNAQSTAQIATQVGQSSALAVLPSLTFRSSSLNSVMHVLDAQISYFMGVLSGLSDMLESVDMAHCKMPDYFLNDSVFCSCGDSPYSIQRREEGLAEMAFWCTGTLSLLDTSNKPYVIYNPYTYAQLVAYASGADSYLACMSSKTYLAGQTNCNPPSAPLLQSQGVSVLTVLTACKNNYLNMQWDKGAHILFNQTLFSQLVRGVDYPTLPASTQEVGACLANPALSQGCQAAFLVDALNMYFIYNSLATATQSQFVDACQVFTGPAANPNLPPTQTGMFRACLDQYANSNCQISSSLWTAQSSNPVPVAQQHAVHFVDESAMQVAVQVKYDAAQALVSEALSKLVGYNDPNVQTVFFSPEGDIMHQMMDCVFMGPYNKVDYWAGDSQGHLSVPVWYRDGNGTSRAVDPESCVHASADKAPPYSCGSPSRQAVIKYFFRKYLDKNQGAVMRDIVTSLTQELAQAWSNNLTYPCLCGDNVTHNLTCCLTDGSNWLPPSLEVVYQTVSADVILRSLTSQIQDFYRHALEEPVIWTNYLDAATLKSYNWTDPVGASIVMREGLYRTDQPVIQYDSSEARSPMITTSIWHQCHGLLSQLFFTIPMQAGVPRNLPDLNGLDGLDAFVSAAVHEAYMHSPLYRHYNVSYVPSESRLCRNRPVKQPKPSRVNVSQYRAGGVLLLDTSTWPSLPAYGTDAFQLSQRQCFCGWDGDGVNCFPPAVVCQTLPALCPSFPFGTPLDGIMAKWSSAWPCPLLALSDHAGVMDSSEMNDWLLGVQRNYTISGGDLLRRGRSGLRVGNLLNLSQGTYPARNPGATSWTADHSLPFCADDYETGPPLLDPDTLLRSFVTRLFPVAQGIYESSTTSYCLRYAVEYALLSALSLAMSGDPGLGGAYAAQRLTSDKWRVRCEGQIALLALCKGLDAYQPPIDPGHRTFPCPFSVSLSNSYGDVYMTPGCLVQSSGLFYDPCNCPQFTCGPSKPYFNLFIPSCQIPFDPRSMVSDSIPLGGWTVSPLEVFDQATFTESILSAGDTVGNLPRGGDWATEEGFLNVTGRHCDVLADWWPTDQTIPVGYHATMPCSSDQTGYRTFDSAFAVERTTVPGEFTMVKMVYQHDLTRTASIIDTQLGGGGVCRASNMGQLIQTNQMRICTRQAGPDALDPSIPSTPGVGTFGPEQCSTDSTSVPWFDETGIQDSSLHSVGTVPNMPSATDTTYPASKSFGIGAMSQILNDIQAGGNGWGQGCSDWAIQTCSTNSNCPNSFFCLLPAGVCMSSDFAPAAAYPRCYRHMDCPLGYMCDGTGTCAQAYITYLNSITAPIEASVWAERCDETNSDTYYTDGASPWEYVPDWLVGHGMCSNKNWYYYSLALISVGSCGSCSSSYCSFNSRKCSLPFNSSVWWPQSSTIPKQFPVLPTVCDRDYEHLRGPSGLQMVGCSPSSAVLQNQIVDNSNTPYPITYAGLFRNYNSDGTSIARLPYTGANSTGFLGMNTSALAAPNTIINCDTLQNCYAYPFTSNGAPVQRTYNNYPSVNIPYNPNDIFRCGVAAYYDSNQKLCILDQKVLPLYAAFCNPRSTQVLDTCTCTNAASDEVGCYPVVNRAQALGICSNIQASYTSDHATIKANNENLQALFGVFQQSDASLAAHVSGTDCFNSLYLSMQPNRYNSSVAAVYYPFMFALYEIPLAWIYQCTYLAGVEVNPSATTIQCVPYSQSQTLATVLGQPPSQPLDSTRLFAGYRRSDIVSAIRAYSVWVNRSIPAVASVPEYSAICSLWGVDCDMVPYCANSQVWASKASLGTLGRQLLAALYDTVCAVDAQAAVLDALGLSYLQAIGKFTTLQGYSKVQNGLPSIPSLLNSILQQCITLDYSPGVRWPLKLSYPQDMALRACFQKYKLEILNTLTLEYADYSLYSDMDSAYAPPKNVGALTRNTVALGTQACVFNDLLEEYTYFNVPTTLMSSNSPCSTQTWQPGAGGSGLMCGLAPCHTYPLVYQTGPQACGYPTQDDYQSLSSLLDRVWASLQSGFISNLLKYGAPNVTLYEFDLFRYNNAYFPGWGYDVTPIQSYMSNINPDTTKEIMCTITDAVVDFTTCNDPNYAALKAFTASLRQRAAPLVPSGKQLNWKASSAFLARGGVFAFANSERRWDQVLLGSIFNDTARCGIGELMSNRVCLESGTGAAASSVRPWVPWMSGQWNPYDTCDVQQASGLSDGQEVIWPFDTLACPHCPDLQGQYRTSYMFPYSASSCSSRQKQHATYQDVMTNAPTNLCYVELNNQDSICLNPQGMVGGGRGQSVLNHPTVPHLYGINNVTSWPQPGGIYPRGNNPLFGGQISSSDYGVLNIPGDEIGAVGIGLEVVSVTGGLPYMYVSKTLLQAQAGYMPDWKSMESKDWIPGLQAAFQAEDALHAVEQANRGSWAWDCPVRRMAFYSGSIPGSDFAPSIPSPGRARLIFNSITGGLSSHPTQVLQRNSSSLGGYTTSNGFCYCPTSQQSIQGQCQIQISDVSHNCSLARTIQALQGQWVQSVAFTPQAQDGTASPCTMQFDWPYLDGQLRDGTTIKGQYAQGSDTVGRKCHLLDRLRPFQYRYKPGAPPAPVPGTSTLDQGGVCHTGRAATLTPATVAKILTTRCVKQSETTTSITVSCEDGTSQTLSKEQSTPLDQMVSAVQTQRTMCSKCSPPPTFVNSNGRTIPAESSFGIPFRFSSSRAVAADLMAMLCSGTPNCSSLINQSAWNEDFMGTLLRSPQDLFVNQTQNQAQGPMPSPSTAKPQQWPSNWVFCNTTAELQTGDCQGSILEADWRQDRFQSCYKEIRALTRNTPNVMSTVDVCLINSDLDNLCTAVSQAQALVREANCLASGSSSCALKPFLYQPSMWDVSNQEFVHGTVSSFYTRIAPGACPSHLSAIIANNEAVLNRCAATPVMAMYIALQACRDVVDTMALVLFYAINILVDALSMAHSGNKAVLEAQIVYYWQSMIKAIQDLMGVLSNLMFDMLFHMGSVGTKIYTFLQNTCGYANTAYRYWLEVWCGIAIDLAPSLLGGIRQIAQMCQTGFTVVNAAMDAIFTTVGMDALSKLESMGFVKGFQYALSNDQSRSKQDNMDSAKQSKKEGLSADKAETKNKKKNAAMAAGAVGGGLASTLEGVAEMAASVAIASNPELGLITGIASAIVQSQENAALMSLYPDNWTLFNFQDVYIAIDTMEMYITSDTTCLNYQMQNITHILNCTFPSLVGSYDQSGAMMVATRCWADSQRDVGSSNLLSCTESDTCYSGVGMSNPIVCGACPDVNPGFSVFGCSSLTKMCTCNTPTTQSTRCTSNDQCYFATTTCQLFTGLDSMSYGNQPCTACTKQVQCIVTDSTGVGTCGCVFQNQPIQQCSQLPGQPVPITSPNSMCGYLVGSDKSQQVTALNWDSLSLARCIYLNPAYIYCAQVYQGSNQGSNQGSSALTMAVGLGMAPLSSSFGRRLLGNPSKPEFQVHSAQSEYYLPDEGHGILLEDWNGTAEPCSSLAHLYQQSHGSPALGPTDTLQLHSCAYWRTVGRRTIQQYNLTSLKGRDGFLLSTDDFAAALAQKWVLVQLLRNPEAMLFAAAHSPFIKPLYAAVLSLRSMSLDLGGRFQVTRNWSHAFPSSRPGTAHQGGAEHAQQAEDEEQDEEGALEEHRHHHHGRRLLNSQDSNTNPNTNIQFANTWLVGPFSWPPPFLTQIASSQCDVATALLNILHDLLSVLTRYFGSTYVKAPTPPRGLWDNLPNFTCYANQPTEPSVDTGTEDSWIASAYHTLWSLVGFQAGYVRQFFSDNSETNIFTVTTSLLKCDFEAVTFCTKHRKDLLASAILLFLFYIIVAYVSGLIGMPILGTALMLVGFIPFLLWYSYGMALTCAPMLPTCLMDDVVYTLNQLFPYQIAIPLELQVSPDCLADPAQTRCLVPCSTPPMAFLGWRDTLAYGACYTSIGLCRNSAGIIGSWDALSDAMLTRAAQIEAGESLPACTFCFWVTLVKLIPLVVVVGIGMAFGSFLVYIPCMLLPKLLSLVAKAAMLVD